MLIDDTRVYAKALKEGDAALSKVATSTVISDIDIAKEDGLVAYITYDESFGSYLHNSAGGDEGELLGKFERLFSTAPVDTPYVSVTEDAPGLVELPMVMSLNLLSPSCQLTVVWKALQRYRLCWSQHWLFMCQGYILPILIRLCTPCLMA